METYSQGVQLRFDALETYLKESSANLFKVFDERDRRYAELAAAESKRLDAIMAAEARRIDALLVKSAEEVGLASKRAEITASTLAERVDTSARALASQNEETAKAAALAVEAIAKTLSARIEPLEAARYVQAGRSGISAPLMVMLAGLGGGAILWIIEHLLLTAK